LNLVAFLIGIIVAFISAVFLAINLLPIGTEGFYGLIIIPVFLIIIMFLFGAIAFKTESVFLTQKIIICAVILLFGCLIPTMFVMSLMGPVVGPEESGAVLPSGGHLPIEIIGICLGLNLLAVIIGGYGVVAES